MKRFYLILLMLILSLTSCATSRYVSNVYDESYDVQYILDTYYPSLSYYYQENVLKISSIKEIILEDGTKRYEIKTSFCRYYYDDYEERMEALRTYYPQIYNMYCGSLVYINYLYKYVDNAGIIRHHVSYRRINYRYPYIDTYGAVIIRHYPSHRNIHHRPAPPYSHHHKPIPVVKPHKPEIHHSGNIGHKSSPSKNNNVGHNNHPRNNGHSSGVRSSNSSRSTGSSTSSRSTGSSDRRR